MIIQRKFVEKFEKISRKASRKASFRVSRRTQPLQSQMYGQSPLYEYTHCAKMSNEDRKARPDRVTFETFLQNTPKMTSKNEKS